MDNDEIGLGREEDAVYRPFVEEAPGAGPLLAALPAVPSLERLREFLLRIPQLPADWHSQRPEVRVILASAAVDKFFKALGHLLDMAQNVDEVIRRGYIRLNPADAPFNRVATEQWKTYAGMAPPALPTREMPNSLGISIIARAGMGKSTSVSRSLAIYPQVIRHRVPELCDMRYKQLVYLHVWVPKGASVRELGERFVRAADSALHTTYAADHKIDRKSGNQLTALMGRIALWHCLGILVIDDVQNLSAQSSGGAEELREALAQFSDCLGIPILAIGTSDAESILDSREYLERRFRAGHHRWEPFKDDTGFRDYTDALCQLSTCLVPTKPDAALRAALLTASNGIPHGINEAFVHGVRAAILSGAEEITPDILHYRPPPAAAE